MTPAPFVLYFFNNEISLDKVLLFFFFNELFLYNGYFNLFIMNLLIKVIKTNKKNLP